MLGKDNAGDEVTAYIKKNLRKGYTKDSLIVALHNQGYSRILVERSMRRAESELAAQAPVLKTKPEIKYEIIQDSEPENPKKKKKWSLFG
ncbi:MAG: hypothetical protein KC506_02935 [Nanoarchaeota archaeon]|nr:hypothetical protein [Nanoarchaeota archaeon]